MTVKLDTTSPDLQALALTVQFATELIERHAPTAEWEALTTALVSEHTPEQLANMLTGAATVIANVIRTLTPTTSDTEDTGS